MKILKFNYSKPFGEFSDRILIPLVEPSVHYFGIDISNMDKEEQEIVSKEFAIIMNGYKILFQEKVEELGLAQQYRTFVPNRMDNIDISFKGDTCPEPIVEKVKSLAGY